MGARAATLLLVLATMTAALVVTPAPPASADSGGPVTTSDGYATLTKTANDYSVSAGTQVTYTYSIYNRSSNYIGGANTRLVDDKCSTVTRGTGWSQIGGAYWIASGRTATYTCTSTLLSTTTNTATLSGMTNGGYTLWGTFAVGSHAVPSVQATATVTVLSTGTPVPWTCATPTVFVANNHAGQSFTSLDIQTQGSTSFSTFPTSGTYNGLSYSYNALAFNKSDRLLYAITNNVMSGIPPNMLITIDSKGVIRNTGKVITGIPTAALGTLNTGFFDDAGNYYVSNGSVTSQLYRINLATGVGTAVTPVDTNLYVNDFTYMGGYAWGIVYSGSPGIQDDKMARIDLATGAITYHAMGLSLPTGIFGANWTYGNGNLGFDLNAGGWYQISVANPGSATPTFKLVSSGAGPASGNNDGASCFSADPTDLSVAKRMTAPVGAVSPGARVTWSVVVTNNGPGISSGFTLTDTLPTGFGSPSASIDNGTCTLSSGTYTCTSAGTLAVGDTRTITISANAPASGCFTNTASVLANEKDDNAANNSSTTAQVCVGAKLDLSKAGGSVTGPDANGVYAASYTVTAAATGTAATSYTQITDSPQVPAGTTLVGVSWSGGPTGAPLTTATESSTDSGSYLIGSSAAKSLAAGASHTYAVVVRYRVTSSSTTSPQPTRCAATPTEGAGLVNSASVPEETEGSANNTACDNPLPRIQVTKTVVRAGATGPGTVDTLTITTGESVDYYYQVTAVGSPEPLRSVTLGDNKCASPIRVSGDTNGDNLLQSTETWLYRCTQALTTTTTNLATVSGTGNASGGSVSGTDTATVTVNGKIGDRVWRDDDGDGVQDAGEPGIGGIAVRLTSAGADGAFGTADDVVTTTTTDASGAYVFTNLVAGTYRVAVTGGTAQLIQTYDLDGLATPEQATLTLSQGAANLSADFGYLQPQPALTMVKAINGQDANTEPGVQVLPDSTLQITFRITNTGNVGVGGLNLTDTVVSSSAISCPRTALAVGEAMTCTAAWPAAAPGGLHHNVGTVTGVATRPDGAPITGATASAQDDAYARTVIRSALPASGGHGLSLAGFGGLLVLTGLVFAAARLRREGEAA